MNVGTGFDLADALTAVETAGLFVSLCSINAPLVNLDGTPVVDSLGQINLTTYTAVPSLQDIPCMRAVLADAKPNPYYEIKTQLQVDQLNVYHVLLDGYYPAIQQSYQAVIDGTAYDILNVESDSQGIMTRLAMRRYSV